MLQKQYTKFKSRHSALRLGTNQYQRAVLGALERMERELSIGTFDENNYRVRTTSPLIDLIFSGFKRLYTVVNNQNQ